MPELRSLEATRNFLLFFVSWSKNETWNSVENNGTNFKKRAGPKNYFFSSFLAIFYLLLFILFCNLLEQYRANLNLETEELITRLKKVPLKSSYYLSYYYCQHAEERATKIRWNNRETPYISCIWQPEFLQVIIYNTELHLHYWRSWFILEISTSLKFPVKCFANF